MIYFVKNIHVYIIVYSIKYNISYKYSNIKIFLMYYAK